MDRQVRARLKWVKFYEEKQDVGYVCRHCGISRPTLRKRFKRYQEHGEAGLRDQSRKPNHSPHKKINQEIEKWVIECKLTPVKLRLAFINIQL